jgi:hypothetical protein
MNSGYISLIDKEASLHRSASLPSALREAHLAHWRNLQEKSLP